MDPFDHTLVTMCEAALEEVQINKVVLEDLKTRFNKTIRTVPQVIIDDKFIGGYHEVEALMKGHTSINKV